MRKNKVVYIDMDGVLVDIEGYIYNNFSAEKIKKEGIGKLIDTYPAIFSYAKPMDGAVEAFQKIAAEYNTYILSTAPWNNKWAWTIKRNWVEQYLGDAAYKKLILSHNKGLLRGNYLIDDRIKNGVADFKGKHIYFGQKGFKDWQQVTDYLLF